VRETPSFLVPELSKGGNVDVQRDVNTRSGLNSGQRRLDATDQISGFLKQNLVPSRLRFRRALQALAKRRAGGHALQLQTDLKDIVVPKRLNVIEIAFSLTQQADVAFHHVGVRMIRMFYICESGMVKAFCEFGMCQQGTDGSETGMGGQNEFVGSDKTDFHHAPHR